MDAETGHSGDGESEGDSPAALLDVQTPTASRLIAAFHSFGWPELLAMSLVVSGVPFAVGAAIAFRARFGPQFLTTGTVYLWTAGLFGGGLTFGWWAKRYPVLWAKVRPVFDERDSEYRTVIRPRVARMYNLGRALAWFPVVLVLGVTYDLVLVGAPYVIYVPSADPEVTASGAVVCLSSDACVAWLGVVNYVFGVVSLVGLLIAIHVVFNHLRLVSDVMELRLRDVQTAATELTPLVQFNVGISAGWFISLTFGMVLLIVGRYDPWREPLYIATFLFLFLFGVALFAVPQLSIHGGLEAEKRKLLGEMDAEYTELYEEVADSDDTDATEELSVQLDVLEARRRNAKEIRTWAYDLSGVMSLLISSVLPLLLQFVQMSQNLRLSL